MTPEGASARKDSSSERGPAQPAVDAGNAQPPAEARVPAAPAPSAVSTNYGPVAIVRDLARDLVRQRRMTAEEANRIEAALPGREWTTVRVCVGAALARRLPVGPVPDALAGRAPEVADAAATNSAATSAAILAPNRVPSSGVDPAELANALSRLVLHLCGAVGTLCGDERLVEHFDSIRRVLEPPLDLARVSEADSRIRSLVGQQLSVQQNLQDARSSLKDLLAMLVDKLGSVGASTARFRERIGAYQQELAATPDPTVVLRVAGSLLAETSQVADQIQASSEELTAVRSKVESYEKRVRALEQELAQTARMVQNDPLTHALNRRGLDEVFRIETARAVRFRAPLSLVMIDLDDFKSINDCLGHAAGDRALVHFVTTARACLRPTDAIARSGGEEFVVVLPATAMDRAVEVVQRMQRELSRSPFTDEDRVVALSFSGGAAQWRTTETLAQVMRRADEAMYGAKRKGKNRIELAQD
jgi:diguanylate cyclase